MYKPKSKKQILEQHIRNRYLDRSYAIEWNGKVKKKRLTIKDVEVKDGNVNLYIKHDLALTMFQKHMQEVVKEVRIYYQQKNAIFYSINHIFYQKKEWRKLD